MDFLSFIKDHFSHAAPILLVGIMAVAITLERFYVLFFQYPLRNVEKFFDRLSSLVMSAKIQEAVQLCDRYRSKPAARIAKTALTRATLPEAVIQDGVLLTIQKCTHAIGKRTSFLATIANVATLLGLFGTIAGLIQSFDAVAHADPQQKSALLSAGIATAMNATMLGLGVAIPCMVVFSFLTNRSNALTADCEQAGIRAMDILKQRLYAPEVTKEEGSESRRAA